MGVAYNPKVVTNGLVMCLDAGNTKSVPKTNLLTAWADYGGNQANYEILGAYSIKLKNTTTGWVGNFPAAVSSTGKYVITFTYYADSDGSSLVLDNDGIMDNAYNTTLTANITPQTYTSSVDVNTTGNITHFFRRNGGGNIYVTNVSYFKLETTWADLSGNGNTGTLTNGPTYSNADGGSLVFDGANDYIQCSGTAIKWTQNGSVGYSNITVEFWIKVNADQGRIFSKPWNGGGQYNIDINESTFGLWAGTSSSYFAHPVSINNNTWRHVTCWADPTNMGIYVNGTQYSSTQPHGLTGGAGSSGDSSVPLALMTLYPYGEGWGGNAVFSTLGQMSICKVYNRVLTTAEIQQNFNALRGRYGI